MIRPLQIGDVIEVSYPRRVPKGHEQEGRRPAIVIGIPENTGIPRHPLVITIPVTTSLGNWSDERKLYVKLNKGEGSLLENSVALTDQIASIDITRIKGLFGTLSETKINFIKHILQQILEL